MKKDNKKVYAIIQARMRSVRLPGKVLMDLCGRPMLWHIVERLGHCRNLDGVVIATSDDKSDDAIVEFCKKYGVQYYRGSLHNALERFVRVIDKYSIDYVVRVCGDTPFPFPEYIDEEITAIKKNSADVIICENPGMLFGGQGVYSSSILRKAHLLSNSPLDLEHVGAQYIVQNLRSLRVVKLIIPDELIMHNIRLTLDTIEDYRFVSRIYADLYKDGQIIDVFMLKEWLQSHMELVSINADVRMIRSYYELSERREKNVPEANIVGTHKIDLARWRKNENSEFIQA